MSMKDGKATAYICEDYACVLPFTEPAKAEAIIDGMLKRTER